MFTDLVLWGGVILLCYAFYKWATKNDDFFEKRGVNYVKPSFLVGNAGEFMFLRKITMNEFMDKLYATKPASKILGTISFRQPSLILRDPEIIKQLAVKDFDHFEDHQNFINENIDVLFGNSLFFLRGAKWRDMRATLSPAFTGSKMRQMFELVSDCGSDMVQTLLKQTESSGNVDCEMKELFSKYTNDVISSTAFGYKINSFENPDNEFYSSGKKLLQFDSGLGTLKMLLFLIAPKVGSFFKIKLVDEKITKFFKSMVVNNMESRDKQGIFRPDMINILMNVKKGNSLTNTNDEKATDGFATVEESNVGNKVVKRVWTEDELVAQCFLFFLAGFDTSSTLLSFVAYELSINPDIQQKLYEECEQTNQSLGEKKLTYDVVQNMKYLDMVVSETLRYWPPVPVIDRMCVKDYNYDDGECKFKIEKGIVLSIPACSLHFDEKYWTDPKKFNPERFSDENKGSIVPGAYMPFGVGPRNCIGSRFALMEAKAVIYYLLLNFRLEPNGKSQIPLKLKKGEFSTITEKGVHVSLRSRK